MAVQIDGDVSTMASQFPVTPGTFETGEKLSSEQMVKTAITLLCAHHEAQLTKLSAVRDGSKPKTMHKLINKYHQFLECSHDAEDAFVAFLHYLSE